MTTIDPTVTPAATGNTSAQVDNKTLQGNLADTEARADVEVGDLDSYVSPGESHLGSIEDRTGDLNSTSSI